MSTVFRVGQFWFLCHTREKLNEPAHVHVKLESRKREARIDLLTHEWLDKPPPDAAKAMKLFHERYEECVAGWNKDNPDRRI